MQYFTWLIIHKVTGNNSRLRTNTVIMLMMKVIEREKKRKRKRERGETNKLERSGGEGDT